MPTPIHIIIDDQPYAAELNDSPTAALIVDSLPIEATGQTWGEEIYFGIPVSAEEEETARAEYEVGELGYWPPGQAFCIFYGPTPASTDEIPKMANPGNPVGFLLDDDLSHLKSLNGSASVRIELA